MYKRILLWGGALAVVLTMMWIVASQMRREQRAELSKGGAISLVPESAALLLRLPLLSGMYSADSSLVALLPSGANQPIMRVVRTLLTDTLIRSHTGPLSAAQVHDAEALLSLHALGNGKGAWGLAMTLPVDAVPPMELLPRLVGNGCHPSDDSTPADGKVAEFIQSDSVRLFALSIAQSLFLTCDSTLAVQAQRSLSSFASIESVIGSGGFTQQKDCGESCYPLLLRPELLAPLLSVEFQGLPAELIARCDRWSPVITGVISTADNTITFSGNSLLQDSVAQRSQRLQAHGTQRMQAISLLPGSTLWVEWEPLPIHDAQRKLALKYGQHGDFKKLKSSDYSEKRWTEDLEALSQAGALEVALAYIGPSSLEGDKGGWVAIIPVTSESEALNALHSWLQSEGVPKASVREKGANPSIIPLKHEDQLARIMGANFEGKPLRYLMPFRGALLFAQEQSILNSILDQADRNQFLPSTPAWNGVDSYLRGECSRLIYYHFEPAKGGTPLREMLANGVLHQKLNTLGKTSRLTFGLQMSAGKGLVFYNAVLRMEPLNGQHQIAPTWRTRLYAPLQGEPQLVKSHLAPVLEVFAQDSEGKLYLVDEKGRILWHRELQGKMLGRADQVDFFSNGKLQYAFTTPGAFYVVDRNGEDVSPFPKSVGCQLSTPLTVMDYDANGDYRFAALCTSKHLHLLDAKGHSVEGFHTPELERGTVIPIEHIRHAGKDYLVACDSNRLYLLNRRGQERVPLQGPRIARSPSAMLYLHPSGSEGGTLITVTEQGQLASVDLATGMTALHGQLPGWRDGIEEHHALFVNLSEDSSPWVIYTAGDVLYAGSLGKQGNRLDNVKVIKQFSNSLHPWIRQFDFGSLGYRVGVVEQPSSEDVEGKLWLLELKEGRVMPGFPLPGSGPFSIGRSKVGDPFELVTSSRVGEIICYSLDITMQE